MDQRLAMSSVVQLEPRLQQMPPAGRARGTRMEQRLGAHERVTAVLGASIADRDLRLGEQALARDRRRRRDRRIVALRARRFGPVRRAAFVQGLHQRVPPFVDETVADVRRLQHLAHGELDPEYALEAEARDEVRQGGDAGAAAHGRRNRFVAQLAGDRLGLRSELRLVERTEPSHHKQAGARDQALARIDDPLQGGRGVADGVDRSLEAGVVVVGDADELHQRGGGDQPAGPVAARREQLERGTQVVAPLLDVGEGHAQPAIQMLPALSLDR